ncbi:uncharacterized protein LOC134184890 [Corticium candelabrum]|uniref:uncharacterized protein LOC134184890 n=1 Tax=Corticium candelabrum TaxID=121492 RepID=UPI002E303BD1|nr:uncharacterized protein LOC134184890 [Corticium candelabrum]
MSILTFTATVAFFTIFLGSASGYVYCNDYYCSDCCCDRISSACCSCFDPDIDVASVDVDITWWGWALIAAGILVVIAAAIGVGVWRRRVYLARTTVVQSGGAAAAPLVVTTSSQQSQQMAGYPLAGYNYASY